MSQAGGPQTGAAIVWHSEPDSVDSRSSCMVDTMFPLIKAAFLSAQNLNPQPLIHTCTHPFRGYFHSQGLIIEKVNVSRNPFVWNHSLQLHFLKSSLCP